MALVVATALGWAGCATRPPAGVVTSAATAERPFESGVASWYGGKFHGRATASGERYDMHAFTAAHPRLAFGTRIRVEHRGNRRTVEVRINDRGPFVAGRVVDLSYAAAAALDMLSEGLAPVDLYFVD